MKIAIFIADSNGGYPVPAVKGGAVSTLVEHLVEKNNERQLAEMTVVSYYDKEAVEKAKKYPNIIFKWIKPPKIIKKMDDFSFFILKTFFKHQKALSFKNLWSLIYYIFKSASFLKSKEYDNVVLENNIPMAWIIKMAKYEGKYFYHFHNVPRINAKVKSVFEKCTGYLCVSDYVAKQIESEDNHIGPIPKSKIKVLYNAVDMEQFEANCKNRLQIRRKFSIKEKDKVVLFVGRLSEEKGIDKLFKAVKLLNNNVKILVVGSYLHGSKEKDKYVEYIKKLANELENKVIFTGFISQKEVNRIYNAADVAVLPSMWDEPAGLTMVEAMASGVPVITTNSGGIPEYSGGYSVVLERNSELEKNIAMHIEKVLEGKQKCLVSEAEKYVRKHFDTRDYLNNFMQCIEELMYVGVKK